MIVTRVPHGRDPADVRCDEGVETGGGKPVENVWVTGRGRGDVEGVENGGGPHSASHSGRAGLKPVMHNGMRGRERGYPRLHTLYYYY